MPLFRITFFYRFGDEPWTEQFYRTLNGTAVDASVVPPSLIVNNRQLRAGNVTFEAVRAQQVDGNRKAHLRTIGSTTPATAASRAVDVTAVALRCLITGVNGATRHLWLRGLRDALTSRNLASGRYDGSAGLSARATDYLNELKALGYQIRFLKDPVANTPTDWRPVLNLRADPDHSQWTKVTPAEGSLIPLMNSKVYFRGYDKDRFAYLKGYFRVMSASQTSFSIPCRYKDQVAVADQLHTDFRNAEYDVTTFQTFEDQDLTTHKTKNDGPTSGHRGRRHASSLRR